MKKITFCLALIGVTMFSCQKPEYSEIIAAPEKAQVQKELTVSDKEWSPADAKSSYEPGIGVTLSGTEPISVFYAEGKSPVVATALGNGNYSFSHEEVVGAETYDYNYLMPHNAATKADGTARLSAVQRPGANTYDPAYDYLIGQPGIAVSKDAAEVPVTSFKRLTAPFNFVIDDEYQLLGGEAISVVTVDFSGAAEAIAGDFTTTFSSDYAAAGISGVVAGSSSTALTAMYPEGLAVDANKYNVWFSSLPVDLLAGQVVSLTVSSSTKTLTCKATLPSNFSLYTNKLNQIPFKLSRFKTDFANVNSSTVVYATEKALTNGESLTISAKSGYVTSKLMVYAGAESFTSSAATAELVLKSGDTEIARKNFNLANTVDMNGGCVVFDNLNSYSDLSLSFVTSTASSEDVALISAITSFVEEPAVPEFTFPERLVRCGGEDLVLPCTAPSRVTKVTLVGTSNTIEPTIKSADNQKLTVTIPEAAAQDVYDVKVSYTADGQNVEKVIGTFSMALDGGEYYRWDNITVYAQSHQYAEKAFCLETGRMVTIDWIKQHEIPISLENPGSTLGTLEKQPRGYHYIMVRGYDNYLRLIDPNAWNTIKDVFFTSDRQSFVHYALPMVRFSSRIEKNPYPQNTAYTGTGGKTTHTPGANEIACYDAIKSGKLTVKQWSDVANDFAKSANNYGLAPNRSMAAPNIYYGHALGEGMNIMLDTYSYNATYWENLEQERNGWNESFHGGVVLWSALVGKTGNIGAAGSRYMNGALELVNWTGAKGTERTQGSMTLNIFRRKTGYEQYYSYDPNMPTQ